MSAADPARRVIVTGSRTWADRDAVHRALDAQVERGLPARGLIVVHGGCTGADEIADEWAEVKAATYGRGAIRPEKWPAEWSRYGPAAGPRRNSAMVAAGAEVVLAFRAPGRSRGTDHCIREALAAGIPVMLHGELPA